MHSTYETDSTVVSPALRIYHPIPTFVPLSGIVPIWVA